MSDIIHLVPNKWVTEQNLIAVTGLRPGTIERARRESWFAGREYMHVSPDGNPKPNSECMYNTEAINHWIEQQASKQPGAHS
ncbi:excisionase family protein [Leclercia sp.]|uniref:excisionase family protein n=1 Tax=Leclercia sp. TaxID=1898428 RepID=UPI0028999237|nr:excisionase family protein [Leclercia sp.]